jgi:TonB-dependent SusC/RagA subfamily outer membrane receptor
MKNRFLFFSVILLICPLLCLTGQIIADSSDSKTFADTLNNEIFFGYSQHNPEEIVSSVAIITGEQLNINPSQNFTAKLQGLVPGISVITGGQPDQIGSITIRGPGSFSGSSPLFIVDGVPVKDLSAINSFEIERIAVLKDAGSQAIYGARAFNGVIEITTKKGIKGLHLRYDFLTGIHLPGKGPAGDLLNAKEYADLQWLVYKNDGYNEFHPIYGPSTEPSPSIPSWAANTDWYAEMTRKAPVNMHQFTLSGGNERVKYLGSFGYNSESGLLIHTFSKKYSLRFNSEWTFLNDRLTLGENFAMSYRRINDAVTTGENNPFLMGPYRSQAIIPVYLNQEFTGISGTFHEGDFGGTGMAERLGNSTNVVADLTRNKNDYENHMGFYGNAWLMIRLVKGLTFTSKVGGTYSTNYGIDYTQATYERSENLMNSLFSEYSGFGSDIIWTHTLQYQASLGIHHINMVAGQESVKPGMNRNMIAMRSGYFSDKPSFRTLSNGNTIVEAGSYFFQGFPLRSIFMNVNYDLKNKYILSLNIRRDKGHNMYSPGEGKKLYSSVSAGWRVGEEEFIKGIEWINDFTIRGSYGKTGNADGNWEYISMMNAGFDATVLNNHLSLTFDWFTKESHDLLLAIELPETAGDPPISYVNSGSIKNSGFDFQIGYSNKWNSVIFRSNLIFTALKNEVTAIANGIQFMDTEFTRIGAISRTQVGHPVLEFYGYRITGLFSDAQEIAEAPLQNGAQPGFFRYANLDTDNEITPDDRGAIGNPYPEYTAALDLSVCWKRVDLNGVVYLSKGNDIFNWTRWWTDFWPSFQGQKSKRLLYDSWTDDNKNRTVPKASNASNFSTNTQSSSYYVEDGSYLRLKTIQLGYRLNEDLLKKVHISSLRIYLQAVNLFTLTKYSGLDPETGNQSGLDFGSYPNVRQFLFGLQLGI